MQQYKIKVLIALAFVCSFACPSYSFDEKTIKHDINNDGIVDILTSSYEGGGGFGWRTVKIVEGKNNETFAITTGGSFGCFLDVVPLDPRFFEKENRKFLEAIEQELFGSPARQELEGSLQWLLAYIAQEPNAVRNKLFTKIVTVPPVWTKGKIQVPDLYHVLIERELVEKLQRNYLMIEGDKSKDETLKAWLVYGGHNHKRRELKLADREGKTAVYTTAHGVIAERGDVHAWVFVSDRVSKLRWPSIGKVSILDNLILISQRAYPIGAYLHVVDVDEGKCARVNPAFFSHADVDIVDFAVEDQNIILSLGFYEGPIDEQEYEMHVISVDKLRQFLQ
jgi:hypothetical protein